MPDKANPADPWTLPASPRPKTRRKPAAKRPAKATAKAAGSKARGSPKAGAAGRKARAAKRPARPARLAKARAAPPLMAAAPSRQPLDVVVTMRPVRAAAPARAASSAPAPAPVRVLRGDRLASLRAARVPVPAATAEGPAVVAAVAPGAPPAPVPTAGSPGPGAAPKRRFRLRNLLAMGAVLAVALAVVAAIPATSQGNSGTIKVHDGATADPDERNEPHVTGDVFIEGSNMAEDGGDLLLYSWPPTGNMTLVLATTWEADDGEPESHFLAGPFELPCGHYRAFAYNGDGPEDPTEPQPGGAKKKTFWVDGCGGENPPLTACPTGLTVVANPDGSVTLFWNDAPGSDGTNIYRAADGGDFEYLATAVPEAEAYTDTTAVPGTSYEYAVTGLYGDAESQQCGVVEVTAIPEFPTLAALGLATSGGALALLLRRRKA